MKESKNSIIIATITRIIVTITTSIISMITTITIIAIITIKIVTTTIKALTMHSKEKIIEICIELITIVDININKNKKKERNNKIFYSMKKNGNSTMK